MILLSNSSTIVLSPGQTATFDKVLLHTGCGEYHRKNTGAIKMKFDGVYAVGYSASVTNGGGTAAVQLTMAIDGAPMPETARISTPSAAGAYNCIATQTLFKNGGDGCCCGAMDYGTVTLINNGTTTITIAPNAAFWVKRES